MLRILTGSTLLLAVTLPLHGAATSEPFVDDGRSLLEQLLHPREPTKEETEEQKEWARQWEENRRRQERNALDATRMLDERRASLVDMGLMFEVSSFGGGMAGSPLLAACLVGETGQVYTFDPQKEAAAQTIGAVNEGAFSKAAALAKSVGHSEWRPLQVKNDFGVVMWTMSFDGRTTLLQIAGDYLGAHPDPRIEDLVTMIDGWCPNAGEIRSRTESPLFGKPPY